MNVSSKNSLCSMCLKKTTFANAVPLCAHTLLMTEKWANVKVICQSFDIHVSVPQSVSSFSFRSKTRMQIEVHNLHLNHERTRHYTVPLLTQKVP